MATSVQDFQKQNPNYLGGANTSNRTQVNQPKPMGVGSFLLNFLPGGSLVDKKIRGEKIDKGDIAEEVALTAIPFGLGKAAKAVRGGKAAVKGAKTAIRAGEGVKDGAKAAKVAAQGAEEGGVLKRFSKTLSERSTLAPTSTIDNATDQARLVDLAQRTPELKGSAARKFKNVDKVITKDVDEVDKLLSSATKTLRGDEVDSSLRLFAEEISDTGQQKTFNRLYNRIVKDRFNGKLPDDMTAKDINSLRRGVNKQAARVDAKIARGATPSAADEAVLSLKDELSDMIDELAPDDVKAAVRAKNRDIATLLGGRKEFKRAAEEGGKLPVVGRVPVVSDVFAGVTQGGADIAGRTLASPVGRFLGGQAATRVGADLTGFRQPDEQAPDLQQDINELDTSLASEIDMLEQAEAASPFSPENIERNVQAILSQGGSMKDVSEYLANAKAIGEITGGGKSDKVAEGKARTASNALDQLERMFGQAGGGQGLGGFAQRVLGKARQNPNVEAYDKLKKTVAVPIARAMGETGPLSDLDIKTWVNALPDITDSPEAAQQKIQTLKNLLAANQGGGSDSVSTQLQGLGL